VKRDDEMNCSRSALVPAATLARATLLGLCIGLALLAGCGTFEVSMADQVIRQARSDARVTLQVEPSTVRVGDALRMRVQTERPGYLYLVQIGSGNRAMTLIHPNLIEPVPRVVQPGTLMVLPGPGWKMIANGPPGTGYYLAIVTDEAQDLAAFRNALDHRRIDVQGNYGAAIVTLREL
jgi:hypothetical protein